MEKNSDQMGSGPPAPSAPGDFPQPPSYNQAETPGGYQTNSPFHAPYPGGYPAQVLPQGSYPAHAPHPGGYPTQAPPGYGQAPPPHFFPGPHQGGYFHQPPPNMVRCCTYIFSLIFSKKAYSCLIFFVFVLVGVLLLCQC